MFTSNYKGSVLKRAEDGIQVDNGKSCVIWVFQVLLLRRVLILVHTCSYSYMHKGLIHASTKSEYIIPYHEMNNSFL